MGESLSHQLPSYSSLGYAWGDVDAPWKPVILSTDGQGASERLLEPALAACSMSKGLQLLNAFNWGGEACGSRLEIARLT